MDRKLMMFAILAFCAFTSSLAAKSIDPLISSIAADFVIPTATAALLMTAYSASYATSQLVLGPLGDRYGRTIFVKLAMGLLASSLLISAVVSDFHVLFVMRIVAGVAGAAVVPMSMALIGDKVAARNRQAAISRFLSANLTGQLLGVGAAGFIADELSWRLIFWCGCGLSTTAFVGAMIGLREPRRTSTELDAAKIMHEYLKTLANPLSAVCFGAVLLEGVGVYGMTPYVSSILGGVGSAKYAGIAISGIGFGGIIYSLCSSRISAIFSRSAAQIIGGALSFIAITSFGSGLFKSVEILPFLILGFGFYLAHTGIYAEATDINPAARATTMTLLSFHFFVGQAIGPIVFGYIHQHETFQIATIFSGSLMLMSALISSFFVRRRSQYLNLQRA